MPSGGPGGSQRRLAELEFPAQESERWRYGPSVTVLPGRGCYAFQVDGTTFSHVIVFRAVHELEGKPQRRTLRLGPGRATRRFQVTAFDPPTHTYDVRVRTGATADIGVRNYDLDDRGGATHLAGKPKRWLPVAQRIVAEEGFNVNRAGVVFVPAVEGEIWRCWP